MSIWKDILGTSKQTFRISFLGPMLKNIAGVLHLRNASDSADAELVASKVSVSGNTIDLNSDAAGAGADWKITLQRPASGMTADVTLTLPVDDGSAGQVLQTDGSGALSWATSSAASAVKDDTTTVAFDASSPVAMFSTGAGDVIKEIAVTVDTAFDGAAPTLAVGISGTTSKYVVAADDVDLKTVGTYYVHPSLAAQGVEALIATLVSDSSTVGSARIQVFYATPA